jgi:hypothetical protein
MKITLLGSEKNEDYEFLVPFTKERELKYLENGQYTLEELHEEIIDLKGPFTIFVVNEGPFIDRDDESEETLQAILEIENDEMVKVYRDGTNFQTHGGDAVLLFIYDENKQEKGRYMLGSEPYDVTEDYITNVYDADANKLKDFIEFVKEEHNVDISRGFITGHS